jgi:hypothetical protein
MRRGEVDRRDQVGEHRGGTMAELGQQERHTVTEFSRCWHA